MVRWAVPSASYHVAANLLRLRLNRGWSMDHLADHAGIPVEMLEQAERHELTLTEDVLESLAAAFAVTPLELSTPSVVLAERCMSALDGDSSRPEFLQAVTRSRRDAERLGFAAVAARAANVEAELLYQEGETASAIHRALSTLTRFRIQSDEDRAGLLWTLGQGWLVADRPDVAGLVFAALVQELPDDSMHRLGALMNLSAAYLARGWYREASHVYRQVLGSGAVGPTVQARAAIGLARCLLYLDAHEQAAALLASAAEMTAAQGEEEALSQGKLARLEIEVRRLTPADYRRRLADHLLQIQLPHLRAHVYEVWARLEARNGQWIPCLEAAKSGLRSGALAEGKPFHLLKARLLWWRSLARERLGLDGAQDDQEWARDLLESKGAPPDYIERYLSVADGASV